MNQLKDVDRSSLHNSFWNYIRIIKLIDPLYIHSNLTNKVLAIGTRTVQTDVLEVAVIRLQAEFLSFLEDHGPEVRKDD